MNRFFCFFILFVSSFSVIAKADDRPVLFFAPLAEVLLNNVKGSPAFGGGFVAVHKSLTKAKPGVKLT